MKLNLCAKKEEAEHCIEITDTISGIIASGTGSSYQV